MEHCWCWHCTYWVPRGKSQGPLVGQWGHPSGLGSWLLLEPEQLFSVCMELHTDYVKGFWYRNIKGTGLHNQLSKCNKGEVAFIKGLPGARYCALHLSPRIPLLRTHSLCARLCPVLCIRYLISSPAPTRILQEGRCEYHPMLEMN